MSKAAKLWFVGKLNRQLGRGEIYQEISVWSEPVSDRVHRARGSHVVYISQDEPYKVRGSVVENRCFMVREAEAEAEAG